MSMNHPFILVAILTIIAMTSLFVGFGGLRKRKKKHVYSFR